MKVIGIIPSRYHSTRLPGKALAKLEGIPMILHVCRAALSCSALDAVYVATDDKRIRTICEDYGCPVLMTSDRHETPTARLREAAHLVGAARYVMIGGDEPLITPADITHTVEAALRSSACVVNAMTAMTTTEEIKDPSNIKLACNQNFECTAISRTPLFRPYECSEDAALPAQMKFVSIGVYTKEALDFFVSALAGPLEKKECCDLLRFMENGKTVELINIGTHTLSVDTFKDLERVRSILKEAP